MKETATSTVVAFPSVTKTGMQTNIFNRAFLVLSGLAMLVGPIAQMTAFASHPQFWTLKKEMNLDIYYGYTQTFGWQFAHFLVYVTLPLWLLFYVQIARLVGKTRPWLALVGVVITWLGYGYVIGNFGTAQFAGAIGNLLPKEVAMPALGLFIENARLMKVTFFGQLGALIGPMIIFAGLALSPKLASRWSGPLALVGNLIVVAFIDIDFFMFIGDLFILIGLLPLALKLLKGQDPASELG